MIVFSFVRFSLILAIFWSLLHTPLADLDEPSSHIAMFWGSGSNSALTISFSSHLFPFRSLGFCRCYSHSFTRSCLTIFNSHSLNIGVVLETNCNEYSILTNEFTLQSNLCSKTEFISKIITLFLSNPTLIFTLYYLETPKLYWFNVK